LCSTIHKHVLARISYALATPMTLSGKNTNPGSSLGNPNAIFNAYGESPTKPGAPWVGKSEIKSEMELYLIDSSYQQQNKVPLGVN
jgi:hypothetical protein